MDLSKMFFVQIYKLRNAFISAKIPFPKKILTIFFSGIIFSLRSNVAFSSLST